MTEKYLIKDTIRFTASIVNLDGDVDVPGEVTVSVYQRDGTVLLDKVSANTTNTPGEYYYDWKIDGTEETPLIKACNLIVVWDFAEQKKRMEFKVIPEV